MITFVLDPGEEVDLAAFNQHTVSNARASIDAQKRDPWAHSDVTRRSLRTLAETSH